MHAMSAGPEVVVVGGGLVGAATAYELAGAGLRVTLVDRHDVGHATDAGAGILSPETMGGMPDPFLDLADAAGTHYRDLIPALAEPGAPDPRYDVCGAFRVAFREMDDSCSAANVAASITRHPGVLQPLDSDGAQACFPPLAPVRNAVFNPHGARVDGRALVEALEFAARRRGVEWINDDVVRIAVEDERAHAVRTANGTIACGAVVVAGGAWTPSRRVSGIRAGVRPVRGQIVHLQTNTDTSRWPVLQPILSHYVVPWSDGRVSLGATVEDVGFDVRSTATGLRQLFSEGLRVSPGLGDATFLEVHAGLRPVSDDDLHASSAGAPDGYERLRRDWSRSERIAPRTGHRPCDH